MNDSPALPPPAMLPQSVATTRHRRWVLRCAVILGAAMLTVSVVGTVRAEREAQRNETALRRLSTRLADLQAGVNQDLATLERELNKSLDRHNDRLDGLSRQADAIVVEVRDNVAVVDEVRAQLGDLRDGMSAADQETYDFETAQNASIDFIGLCLDEIVAYLYRQRSSIAC